MHDRDVQSHSMMSIGLHRRDDVMLGAADWVADACLGDVEQQLWGTTPHTPDFSAARPALTPLGQWLRYQQAAPGGARRAGLPPMTRASRCSAP